MNLMEASVQWAKRPTDQRFETLETLQMAVDNRRNQSRAFDVPSNTIRVKADDGRLVVNGATLPALPTHWGFGQLCQRAKAPASYLRTLPVEQAASCLNISLDQRDSEPVKILTRCDADAPQMAAVTSQRYGRIWDADVVASTKRLVERTGGRFFNPKEWGGKPSGLYASDHDVFIFMIDGGSIVDGGGPRDQLNRGFMVWNSEVGASTFGLMTFLFRVVCGNHIIWGAEDVNRLLIRHTSGAPSRFDAEAMPALLDYVNASASVAETTIRKAKDILLPDDETDLFNRFGTFTRPELRMAMDYARREEGDCRTLWQLVNGLTASARDLEYIDARVDLERRAGRLLETV
jgi:hypothetical protein